MTKFSFSSHVIFIVYYIETPTNKLGEKSRLWDLFHLAPMFKMWVEYFDIVCSP
jgi:hypothetical protein